MDDGFPRIEARAVAIECDGVADLRLMNAAIRDGVSSIYAINADVFTLDRSLSEADFLGKRFKITLEPESDRRRFWGICVSVSHLDSHVRTKAFSLRMCPWLWALTQNVDSRIFQKQTCIEIAKEVAGHNAVRMDDKTTGSFPKIEYAVQYAESDYALLKQILETYGVYFYFSHSDDGEVMVLCDGLGVHGPLPDHPEVQAGFRRDQEHAWQFGASRHVVPTEVTKSDTDFTKIRPKLSVR